MVTPKRIDQRDDHLEEEFKSLRLHAVRISGKEFEGCTFAQCAFRECQFLDCKFNDCAFVDCDLSSASFSGSSFRDARFDRCKVAGVNWTLASWSKFAPDAPLRFGECNLDFSTFMGLTLRKLLLKGCTAREADFSDADLSHADFGKTDLAQSRFRNTNLTGANFEGAFNYTIDVMNNTINKARFSLPEAVSLLRGLDIELVDDTS